MFIYKHYDLIKGKYFIEYWFNRDDSCYAKIYYWESINTYVQIGMLITYRETVSEYYEDEKAHWTADCHLEPKHLKKELIDAIGKELLERTSCEEPLVLRIYKGNMTDGDFRVYGDLHIKE